MQIHKLEVLGVEVSFKAEVAPQRLEQAKNLLCDRYNRLREHGKHISKEKLLIYLSLALADDLLQAKEETSDFSARVERLLTRIEQQQL